MIDFPINTLDLFGFVNIASNLGIFLITSFSLGSFKISNFPIFLSSFSTFLICEIGVIDRIFLIFLTLINSFFNN